MNGVFPDGCNLVQMLSVHLALFVVTLISACTFSFSRLIMPQYLPPMGFIVLRVGFAFVAFVFFHLLFVRKKVDLRQDGLRVVVCAITGCGANMLLFFKGLSITTPINGAILMACTPVFVVVIAAFLTKERLSVLRYMGIGVAFLGAQLLMGGRHFSFDPTHIRGDIAVALNAIIYSFYLVCAKPLLQKYGPITLSVYSFGVGFVFVFMFGCGELQEVNFDVIPARIWYYICFILFGVTFVSYLLNAWALRHASPSTVGSYIYLQPLLAGIIALLNHTDVITLEKAVYMIVILTGVYLVNRQPNEVAGGVR